MRLRAELIAATALVVALGIGAAAFGASRARISDADRRRSTFLAGPSGALGFRQALERLGVQVEALRRPFDALPTSAHHAEPDTLAASADSVDAAVLLAPADSAAATLLAVLGPTRDLTVREATWLLDATVDLLIAGPGAGAVISCLGYDWRRAADSVLAADSISATSSVPIPDSILIADSLAIAESMSATGFRSADAMPAPGVPARLVLQEAEERLVVDSSEVQDGVVVTCRGPAPLAVDTLLRVRGDAGALRLHYEGGRAVTLVADDQIFANRSLRTTAAGPFALGLVVGRYDRVVVDEYHHGFTAAGSLPGALLAWSMRSPWGWAAWQLAMVGILGLLASGIRFGPVRRVIDRRRRSPLEHVRALATALAAAQGHGVAITLLVRGLRRRLSPGGQASSNDDAEWLAGLHDVVQTERGRQALETLQALVHRPADTEDVRRAANAVEDVWEALTKISPGRP